MRIRLKLFATFREIIGEKDMVKDVDAGSTVEDIVAELLFAHPKLEPFKDSMIYSVNKEYADASKELSDGDEVGILPPVTGG
jgi:MoaD family protein